MNFLKKNIGVAAALVIISLWGLLLIYLLSIKINWSNPITYVFVLIQMHLYTGLFITAHDSIHGVVSENKKLNRFIGIFCTTLFSFNYYSKLEAKHHLHHQNVVTELDPDYYKGSFLMWYLNFLKQYVTLWQILAMAITYNILKLYIPMENLIVFWMIPAVLSTFQLFYFGTYQPHKGEHNINDQFKAKSQKLNHFYAFITCYFFGYHHEHHAMPYLPWWKLAKAKSMTSQTT